LPQLKWKENTHGDDRHHRTNKPHADMDQAADALTGAAFGSAGERCMSISVAIAVGDGTAEALLPRMRERISRLKVADGTAAGAEMGPLVTGVHRDKVAAYIELGVKEGAELGNAAQGQGLLSSPASVS
jgi:malonate-semialdehyde dehydrogenase (acetylating) / methylmalonate-semialdehyde dehydrogenase